MVGVVAALKALEHSDQPHEKVARALAYLALAHDSASQALNAMETLRTQRRAAAGQTGGGQTSYQDQDLLRSMLVFACAGVDAATKTLIRDAMPALAEAHTGVRDNLTKFAEGYVSDGRGVSAKALARLFTSDKPARVAMIDAYVDDLTGGSLQSSSELHRVCAALGVENKPLRARVTALEPMFRARNEIIHELDLAQGEAAGGRTRRHRAIGNMVEWASDALQVAQLIIDAVSVSLSESA
jgi:hypothetical protein